MKFKMLLLLPATFMFGCAAIADEPKSAGGDAKITPLFATDLADLPGKEGMMLTVEIPPGHVADAHRHDAHTFVYVLEGEIQMQVAGGELKRLKPGEVFYENPKDVHTMATNASKTKPAKFLVVFVKNKGAPPVLPAKP